MQSQPLDKKDIHRLRALIDNAEKIAITAHVAPDGDAIGSSLGLAATLGDMGKEVHVVVPDDFPKNLAFLPGAKDIVVCSRFNKAAQDILHGCDLLFCLDYNDIKRIDRMAPMLDDVKAPKVMIDHHLEPSDLCDIVISQPELSSTCLLLFKVMCALELYEAIDRDAATCLMAGMMTDTGNFSYNANDPELYTVTARLLEKGVDRNDLSKRLFDTFTESSLRINGYALSNKLDIWKNYGAALITLTREELNRFHYTKGDTEGLVNKPLGIPGVKYSAFFREEERYIKVSMRSVGDFPVDKVCADYFGGGGHTNAAGGEFYGSMAQAVEVFKSVMPENKKRYG